MDGRLRHRAITRPPGLLNDLWAKALVLEDAARHARGADHARPGRHRPRRGRSDLRRNSRRSINLPRANVAICCSHTHSGPVVGHNLRSLHYDQVDAEQTATDRSLRRAS